MIFHDFLPVWGLALGSFALIFVCILAPFGGPSKSHALSLISVSPMLTMCKSCMLVNTHNPQQVPGPSGGTCSRRHGDFLWRHKKSPWRLLHVPPDGPGTCCGLWVLTNMQLLHIVSIGLTDIRDSAWDFDGPPKGAKMHTKINANDPSARPQTGRKSWKIMFFIVFSMNPWPKPV